MESQTSASFVIHPKIALLLLLLIAIRSTKTHYPSMIIVDTRTSEYGLCESTIKQEVCSPRLADTVCPPASNDTGTAFCFPN